MKISLILVLTTLVLFSNSLSFAEPSVAPVYIDVRTWAEHAADNISGDTRIHVSEIVEGVESLIENKDTPIYLYCAVGGRAGKAAQKLSSAGYTNVHNAGGIDDVRRSRAGLVPEN